MKVYSWNLNGIRSAEESLIKFISDFSPDILMLQEIRAHPDQISFFLKTLPGYQFFFNDSGKPGYSGTGLYYKEELNLEDISSGVDLEILGQEGRFISFTHKGIKYINVYTPNGNSSEERLRYKLRYYQELKEYAASLIGSGGKVIIGGDLNVAHTEIDLFAPKTSRNSGYLPEEREWFDQMLDLGFVDTYRMFDNSPEKYTWWHLRDPERKLNRGWRYDYFLSSENLKDEIKGAEILRDVFGSDHCPIMVEVGGSP